MGKAKIDMVNIDIEKLLSIGEKIIHRHSILGPESPLQNGVVADLNARISGAREKHSEVTKYKKLMEDALRDRDYFLGGKDKGVYLTLTALINILDRENYNLDEWI